jgi:hypothetical protein
MSLVVGVTPSGHALFEDDEEGPELFTLRRAEGAEQLVLGLSLRARGKDEPALALRGQADEMTPPIRGVALSREQPRPLERVEQSHEDARVDRHGAAQLPLPDRASVVEESEELELPRRDLVSVVRLAQTTHRVLAQQREQKPRTRAALVKQASRRLDPALGARVHASSICARIVEYDQ